jgi:iron(III) transport system substrate-binding protein
VTRAALALAFLSLAGCRIETAAPQATGPVAADGAPRGEVWVYTSMYRHVLDAFEPLLKQRLPEVTVKWVQGGSEKVSSRLEAELAAGGSQADLLLTSDPFLYARYRSEGRWLRYASPNGLRTPRSLVDLDGHFAAARLSTMVLVHREGEAAPESFAALADPKWKDAVALGDPLTSGTAFTWAVFTWRTLGKDAFQKLRDNGARVAGGNAAVLQKVEGGEAKVGVVLLENVLAARARGSRVAVAWPSDGAVLVPGPVGILKTGRNPGAAKAVVDVLLSPEGQALIVEKGDMHGVDPRAPGPKETQPLDWLLPRTQPWSEELLAAGLTEGEAIKDAFSKAFSH